MAGQSLERKRRGPGKTTQSTPEPAERAEDCAWGEENKSGLVPAEEEGEELRSLEEGEEEEWAIDDSKEGAEDEAQWSGAEQGEEEWEGWEAAETGWDGAEASPGDSPTEAGVEWRAAEKAEREETAGGSDLGGAEGAGDGTNDGGEPWPQDSPEPEQGAQEVHEGAEELGDPPESEQGGHEAEEGEEELDEPWPNEPLEHDEDEEATENDLEDSHQSVEEA